MSFKIIKEKPTRKALFGWRNWVYPESLENRLSSTGLGNQIWNSGINRAHCIINSNHSAPLASCECGLYAHHQIGVYDSYFQSLGKKNIGRKIVPGVVAGRGKIQLHRAGFRAEEMQIIGLLNDGRLDFEQVQGLSDYYQAPAFNSAYEIFNYFDDFDYLLETKARDDRFEIEDYRPRKTNHNGVLHSFSEEPAEVDLYGTQRWYRNGLLHREGEPAEIYLNGYESWYRNGKIHRDDGPAKIFPDRTQFWYKEGRVHREDGPAVIDSSGNKEWLINDQIHREDGPAIVYANGQVEWWCHDKRHREGGPAIIQADGKKLWYRHGRLYKTGHE